ncbi:ligase-associated DNA damage response endonuclease PdeM [Sphaerotilus mobilis]|uniref:Putative phosphoesterase n=1 Tax=Sphaerotilus mobilis TaxID=47994 RepID=A0A4Q7LVJ2_9BURK|nr:ligase-associated DNA damage response endonuclease PdeM [Sphaerotilus mobilis]RZS58741.1 putative phosphoesterase [Sphaerotilus mobilis]
MTSAPTPHLDHVLPDGRPLTLLPERAAYLADAGLLLVADVHLGKAASFRRLGVPVPAGTTEANLARLDDLLARWPVRHLAVLGDLLHAATGRAPATMAAIQAWRERHAHLPITLVRGNHDDHAGDPPPAFDIEVVDEPHTCAGLALCHDPKTRASGFALAGHIHPVTRIGHGLDSVRLPCFHASATVLVLPAFGEFTGGQVIRRLSGDQLYGTTGERVYRL